MAPCDHTAGLPCPRHHVEPARAALAFWQGVADENGWTVTDLTVWVDRDGNTIDSVATRDGQGRAYVVIGDEVATSIALGELS